MPENNNEDATTKLAHVLFMDIVGYSKLPIDDQKQITKELKEIVRETKEVKTAPENQLFRLFTGDGMALVFFSNPLAPVNCAVEISKKLKEHPKIELRIGIHSGVVEEIVDVNDKPNVAGGGINTAQRVMDCGDGGHILLSERVAEDLKQYSRWQPYLYDLSETEVKHGVVVHVYNLASDSFGNSQLPEKFRKRKNPESKTSSVLLLLFFLIVGGALVFAVYNLTLILSDKNKPVVSELKPEKDFFPVFENKKMDWINLAFSSQGTRGGVKDFPSAEEKKSQVWTTAQCLTGILNSGKSIEVYIPKIKLAFDFIENSRRKKPAEGWNLYGDKNPYTVTEIHGWVTIAYINSLETKTNIWNDAEKQKVLGFIERELKELKSRQNTDGGWRPIRDEGQDYARTYSSTIALWSFLEAKKSAFVNEHIGNQFDDVIHRGISWLLSNYKSEKGWVQNPYRVQSDRFDGLTAQILYVLCQAEHTSPFKYIRKNQTYVSAKKEFVKSKFLANWSIDGNNSSVPSPDLRFYETEFMAQGTRFLWFPWTLVTLANLSKDEDLSDEERKNSDQLRLEILNNNYEKIKSYVETENLMFILGENLFCVSLYLDIAQN